MKKPQDHQEKTTKPVVEDCKVTIGDREVDGWEITLRGVTVHVPREAFDDFELLDDMAQLERAQPHRLASVLRRLVAPGDFQTAMDVLRDSTTGRVKVEDGMNFVLELMQAVNPNG